MIPSKRHWRMEVQWEDSTVLGGGWKTIGDIDRDAVQCLSVGFVLASDKRGIVLGASIHGNEAAGITVIPRRSILKTRRLR